MSDSIQVRNPRNGLLDYELTPSTSQQIADTTAALRTAQPVWQALGMAGRIGVLRQFGQALAEHGEQIVPALSIDTGRHAIARQELGGLIRSIERWCGQAPGLIESEERASAALPHIGIQQRLTPYPVVGAISPWNFPLLLSFIDVTPALLAGCSVVIKPSEVTPRFAEPVAEAIGGIPELASVLQFVAGDGRVGAELIKHVDVVAFTGSVATGRKVAAAAAESFIPGFLELGGKDPVIVLEGSDLERATDAILRASIAATGQACQSLERIYVQQGIHDEFVELLSRKAGAVELSYPDPHSGIIGPLIFERQADIIDAHVADAVSKGAVVHTGGEIEVHGGGQWVRPTVVSRVSHDMQLMTDETFGPVMPVMAFADEAEAIALANDSLYGLSAAVFAPTEARAIAIAEQLNAGGISINDAGMTTMIFEEPKSGFGYSGMGPSRMGASGLLRFYRNKALYLNRGDVMTIDAMRESD